jgi:hypothetical protein
MRKPVAWVMDSTVDVAKKQDITSPRSARGGKDSESGQCSWCLLCFVAYISLLVLSCGSIGEKAGEGCPLV